MSFKPYPKYKESGVEWLGRVPEHWEVRRLRQIGPLLKGSGGTKEDVVETGVPCVRYGDLYTTHAYFVRQSRTCVTDERSADYFPIHRGDVLFAASGEDLAEIGRSAVNLIDGDAVCGGDLVVLRPQISAVPEFLGYACDSWVAKAQKAAMGRGTTVKHIYPDELKRLTIALPSPEEQARIASFLAHETAKIDALIAEQQRLIELLQEKRQAVISHAVTKGLNPDAPMKDSGIEWLGEVPEHWEVTTLGRITTSKCDGPFGSGLKSEHYTDSGVRVIRLQNIRSEGFSGNDEAFIDAAYCATELNGHDVLVDDLLIAGLGDERNTVGRACVAPAGIEPAMVKADCFRFRLDRNRAIPSFVALALSANAPADAGILSTGSTRSRIPLSVMGTRRIALPPLEDQAIVVAFVDRQVANIAALVAAAEGSITLLQERRSALISAAVTGQIDVRGFAGTEAA